MTPEQEKLLLDYVAEGKTERVGLARKVSDGFHSLKDATARILHQFELHEQKDDLRFQQLADMVKGANARLEKLEKNTEDTGRHNIVVLEEHIKERKQDTAKWMQFWVGVGVSVIVMATGGGISLLITKAFGK